jgi:hypothetical protein
MRHLPSPSTPDDRYADRDRGAALVVAIGFMVMIGAMAAGLTAMVTSGVGNRMALDDIRDRQYAADGAVEQAVASMRAGIAAGTVACAGTATTRATLNSVPARVDATAGCVAVTGSDGLPVRQFVGRFSACVDSGQPCAATTAIVSATVAYQLDASGQLVTTSVRSWSVLR